MDKYAVIGNPIIHSKSPLIHSLFAEQTKQLITYIAIEAPLNDFENTIRKFQQENGKGANITSPFKQQALQIANDFSDQAERAQAANTLKFRDDQTIFADNTDGIGFIKDLVENHHFSIYQRRILIIGAGGAVSGILGPLLDQTPSEIVIINRTSQKAIDLAQKFQLYGQVYGFGFNKFVPGPYDLIINGTSAGLTGEILDLPTEIISSNSWCYDLTYADQTTSFLLWAKKHGAKKCIDGLGMLVEQAAASFYLWRGIYPDTKNVLIKMRNKSK